MRDNHKPSRHRHQRQLQAGQIAPFGSNASKPVGGPTPWGWPRHHTGPGLGERLNQLTSERRTIDDPAYKRKARASIRALLEDRYGHEVKTNSRDSTWLPEFSNRPISQARKPWGW